MLIILLICIWIRNFIVNVWALFDMQQFLEECRNNFTPGKYVQSPFCSNLPNTLLITIKFQYISLLISPFFGLVC